MKLLKVSFRILLAASLCVTTGCATLFSISDTGMERIRPYSGVRATLSDWEGCSEKPWDIYQDQMPYFPLKLYLRTIDLPLSFAMDTLWLPLTCMVNGALFDTADQERWTSKDVPSMAESRGNPPLKDFLVTQ